MKAVERVRREQWVESSVWRRGKLWARQKQACRRTERCRQRFAARRAGRFPRKMPPNRTTSCITIKPNLDRDHDVLHLWPSSSHQSHGCLHKERQSGGGGTIFIIIVIMPRANPGRMSHSRLLSCHHQP